jgi:hypothetical protein
MTTKTANAPSPFWPFSHQELKQVLQQDDPFNIVCLIRQKQVPFSTHEVMRQLLLHRLLNKYRYPAWRIQLNYISIEGVPQTRSDIVIMRPKERYNIGKSDFQNAQPCEP